MQFVVYENKPTRLATIHAFEECGKQSAPGAGTANGHWHGLFDSYEEALAFAEQSGKTIRHCLVCERRVRFE